MANNLKARKILCKQCEHDYTDHKNKCVIDHCTCDLSKADVLYTNIAQATDYLLLIANHPADHPMSQRELALDCLEAISYGRT